MSSVYFATQPAARAVSRGLIGTNATDPVATHHRRAREPRAQRVTARVLRRVADSLSG